MSTTSFTILLACDDDNPPLALSKAAALLLGFQLRPPPTAAFIAPFAKNLPAPIVPKVSAKS